MAGVSKRSHAAGGDHGRGGRPADAQAGRHGGNLHQDGAHVPEHVDLAEKVHHGAETHVGEQNFGGLGALLSGLVNFGGGYGFGERKLGILHHDAPQQGDEQDAQQSADDHQRHRLPVAVGAEHGIAGVVAPQAGDDESGNGEDGAGGHRFADGADRAGDVFLEDRALHQAKNGHADDGRRVGGGDGHAGAQAEISVGGAQNAGHEQPENHGAGGELRHGHGGRHEGLELLRRRLVADSGTHGISPRFNIQRWSRPRKVARERRDNNPIAGPNGDSTLAAARVGSGGRSGDRGGNTPAEGR